MSDDGPGDREVAHRVFAAEYEDADHSFKESDEERAPSYVVTPSGAKANRVFFVGVLTEIEQVNEDMLRARVVDPTGAFVVYAGQYQPDARTFFERADPPEFVAVSGKARTFQPEDSDRVFTSVRPESVSAVDADTRDRWVLDAAEQTLARVSAMAQTLQVGEEPAPTTGVGLALDHYHTSTAYLEGLHELALDAVRVVAGERDEVRPLEADPDAEGGPAPDELAGVAPGDVERSLPETVAGDAETAATAAATDADADDAAEASSSQQEATVQSGTGSVEASGTETETASSDVDAETDSDVDVDAETGAAVETEDETVAEADTPVEADAESGAAGSGSAAVGDEGEPGSSTAGTPETTSTPEEQTESGADTGGTGDGSGADEIGDFEPGDLNGQPDDVEVESSTDEMYELDEDERREVEEEYGTEFSTGTEVDSPGEAGIETPDSEPAEEGVADPEDAEEVVEVGEAEEGAIEEDVAESEAVEESAEETAAEPAEEAGEGAVEEDVAESEAVEETAEEPAEDVEEEAIEDVDLDEAVMDRMRDLDEGSGADHEELVAAVVDATGADPGDVEDAIQDALMGGQCYEPDDGVLKPI